MRSPSETQPRHALTDDDQAAELAGIEISESDPFEGSETGAALAPRRAAAGPRPRPAWIRVVPAAVVATLVTGIAFMVHPSASQHGAPLSAWSANPSEPAASSAVAAASPDVQTPSAAQATRPTPSRPSAKPTTVDSPTPRPQKAPVLDKKTRWTTKQVRVRSAASATSKALATVPAKTSLQPTGITEAGFHEVIWKGATGWVASKYLTTKKPAAGGSDGSETPTPTPGGAISGSPCASGSGVEAGLRSNAIAVHRAVCAQFPGITRYLGRRGTGDFHGSGRALDIMISGPTGWALAKWLRANASRLGITEVIFAQHIWTTQRSREGWRWMRNRGSATANHYDHVHVSVR